MKAKTENLSECDRRQLLARISTAIQGAHSEIYCGCKDAPQPKNSWLTVFPPTRSAPPLAIGTRI